MPVVPINKGTGGPSGHMPIVPSEGDLLTALAIMHGKGKLASRLDQEQEGNIEDRRSGDFRPEMSRLQDVMGSMGFHRSQPPTEAGQLENEAGLRDLDTDVVSKPLKKTRASIGVSGGSR